MVRSLSADRKGRQGEGLLRGVGGLGGSDLLPRLLPSLLCLLERAQGKPAALFPRRGSDRLNHAKCVPGCSCTV